MSKSKGKKDVKPKAKGAEATPPAPDDDATPPLGTPDPAAAETAAYEAAEAAEADAQERIAAANKAVADAEADAEARIRSAAHALHTSEAAPTDPERAAALDAADQAEAEAAYGAEHAAEDLEEAQLNYGKATNQRRATMAALKKYESDNPVDDHADRLSDPKWENLAAAANRAVNQKEAATLERAAAKDAANPDL